MRRLLHITPPHICNIIFTVLRGEYGITPFYQESSKGIGRKGQGGMRSNHARMDLELSSRYHRDDGTKVQQRRLERKFQGYKLGLIIVLISMRWNMTGDGCDRCLRPPGEIREFPHGVWIC